MSQETGHILVVDDEPLMRGLMLKALEDKGHHIETCEDGKSALDKLTKTSFDLVITDHSMPRMTGVELIRKCRAAGRRVPFILMTSYPLEELMTDEGNLVGVRFLRKPFGLVELHSEVRKAIQSAKH